MKTAFPINLYSKKVTALRYGVMLFFCGYFKNSEVAGKLQEKACKKIGKLLNWDINIRSLRITKRKWIFVENITIGFPSGTKLVIGNFNFQISLRSILKGRAIKNLSAENIRYELPIPINELSNTDYHKKEDPLFKFLQKKYYHRAFHALHRSIIFCPSKINIKNVELAFPRVQETVIIKISKIGLQNKLFIANIESSYFRPKTITIHGCLDKNKKLVSLDNIEFAESPNTSSSLSANHNLSFDYKTIKVQIQMKSPKFIAFSFSLSDFCLHWLPLSEENIRIRKFEMNIELELSKTSFQITKNSVIKYNGLSLNILACHYFPDLIQITLQGKNISMDTIFGSYNHFKYRPLYDFKFSGELSKLTVTFASEMYSPYKYYFKHEIPWGEVKLLNMSDAWPDLNKPFVHQIYENGNLVRNILLSDRNEYFMKIGDIPKSLQEIILFTEDPNFYTHKGVDDQFIGHAIIQNMVRNKIVRGGSTITMQLVRNIFLGHKRIISRKVEEILISLLIENVFKIPKTRILELYLNLIEFGPDVYGIKEASSFYFSKFPSELSTTEILVLSYIIPRPKYFLDAVLSSSEQLIRNLRRRIQFLSKALVTKNIITQTDFDNINMRVCIRGVELNLLKEPSP